METSSALESLDSVAANRVTAIMAELQLPETMSTPWRDDMEGAIVAESVSCLNKLEDCLESLASIETTFTNFCSSADDQIRDSLGDIPATQQLLANSVRQSFERSKEMTWLDNLEGRDENDKKTFVVPVRDLLAELTLFEAQANTAHSL
jgi:hypothetical protein